MNVPLIVLLQVIPPEAGSTTQLSPPLLLP